MGPEVCSNFFIGNIVVSLPQNICVNSIHPVFKIKPQIFEKLMHEAAENDCENIFKWVLDCLTPDQLKESLKNSSFIHSISRGSKNSYDLYNVLLKKMGKIEKNEKGFIKGMTLVLFDDAKERWGPWGAHWS